MQVSEMNRLVATQMSEESGRKMHEAIKLLAEAAELEDRIKRMENRDPRAVAHYSHTLRFFAKGLADECGHDWNSIVDGATVGVDLMIQQARNGVVPQMTYRPAGRQGPAPTFADGM